MTDRDDKAGFTTTYQWLGKPPSRESNAMRRTTTSTFYTSHNAKSSQGKLKTSPHFRGDKGKHEERVDYFMKTSQSFYPKKEKEADRFANTTMQFNRQLPFFVNFVEDEFLDKIPKLQLMQEKKHAGFRKFNRIKGQSIPSETTIRNKFTHRIPVQISSLENDNTQTHVLSHPENAIEMIESYAQSLRISFRDSKNKKNALKSELADLKRKTENSLDDLLDDGIQALRHYWGLLRLDSLDHQNTKMKMHKQIQRLKKDQLPFVVLNYSKSQGRYPEFIHPSGNPRGNPLRTRGFPFGGRGSLGGGDPENRA